MLNFTHPEDKFEVVEPVENGIIFRVRIPFGTDNNNFGWLHGEEFEHDDQILNIVDVAIDTQNENMLVIHAEHSVAYQAVKKLEVRLNNLAWHDSEIRDIVKAACRETFLVILQNGLEVLVDSNRKGRYKEEGMGMMVEKAMSPLARYCQEGQPLRKAVMRKDDKIIG